jgi:hypothetical protein
MAQAWGMVVRAHRFGRGSALWKSDALGGLWRVLSGRRRVCREGYLLWGRAGRRWSCGLGLWDELHDVLRRGEGGAW